MIERFVFAKAPGSRQVWQKEMAKLTKQDLAELADLVPVRGDLDEAFYQVLRTRGKDLPADCLLEGLARSLRFLPACREAELDDRAFPIVMERLEKRVPLDWKSATDALIFVAERGGVGDTESLRWHFVHSDPDQRTTGGPLSALDRSGFESTLGEAWHFATARISGEPWQLAPFALSLGEKEALRVSLVRLRAGCPEWERRQLIERLEASLGTPQGVDPVNWAEAHFDSLRFDPESGRFEADLP